MLDHPNSHNATDRIALAGKVRQLAKEMTVGDPKTAAMLIQAARAIERQPAQQDGPSEPVAWAIVEPGTNEVIAAFPEEQAAITARPSMDHDTIPLYAAPQVSVSTMGSQEPAAESTGQPAGAAPKQSAGADDAPDYKALWLELIMAVGYKFPDETRHQTAKRYILQAERGHGAPGQSKQDATDRDGGKNG